MTSLRWTLACLLFFGSGAALVLWAAPPAGPTVQFAINSIAKTVSEAGELDKDGKPTGKVTLTVTLNEASAETVCLQAKLLDGTATNPADYNFVDDPSWAISAATVVFWPGETEKAIEIYITNDTIAEETESFTVVLSNAINATLGANDTATVTIEDDDGAPSTVQFASTTYSVNEAAGEAVIQATLIEAATSAVTVKYRASKATGANAAEEGDDFTVVEDELTFKVGEKTKSFSVPIVDDNVAEKKEKVRLKLTVPKTQKLKVQLGKPSTATLTIMDNDVPAPTLALQTVSFSGDGNFFKVHADSGDQGPYNAPHWVDLNPGEQSSPVCYVRNTKMRVAATFALTSSPLFQGVVLVKGSGPDDINIPPTRVSLNGSQATLPPTAADIPFPDHITYYYPMTISWSASADGGSTWTAIGESRNKVYVTLYAPITKVYHTLLWLGRVSAQGEKGDADAVRKIWTPFEGLKITTEDGVALYYYKSWKGKKPTENRPLLATGDGDCFAWSCFFVDECRTNGINVADDIIKVNSKGIPLPNPKRNSIESVIVKNWAVNPVAKNKYPMTAGYMHTNIATNISPQQEDTTVKPSVWKYVWDQEQVVDKAGIPGQNNPEPASMFPWHALVKVKMTGKYYDPSYGKTYDYDVKDGKVVPEEIEAKSIDYFARRRSEIPAVANYKILDFRPNPGGVDLEEMAFSYPQKK